MTWDTRLSFIWLCVLAAFAYVSFPAVRYSGDVHRYREIGRNVAEVVRGSAAVLDTEYPPLLASLFYGLLFLPLPSFPAAWSVFQFLVLISAAAYAALYLAARDRWLASAAISVSVVLLGPNLVYARTDVLIGLLLILAWRSWSSGRPGHSAFWLALGGGLKIVPLVLLPIVLLQAHRRPLAAALSGAGLGLAVSVVIPVMLIGPQAFFDSVRSVVAFQGQERGFQVESTWSGAAMLSDYLAGRPALITWRDRTHRNERLTDAAVQVSRWLLVMGLAALYVLAASLRRLTSPAVLPLLFLAAVSWVLVVSHVLSPQFLVWLVPMAVVWELCELRRPRDIGLARPWLILIAALVAAAAGLTQWIYPAHYGELVTGAPVPLVVLNVRNALLVALWAALIAALLKLAQKRHG